MRFVRDSGLGGRTGYRVLGCTSWQGWYGSGRHGKPPLSIIAQRFDFVTRCGNFNLGALTRAGEGRLEWEEMGYFVSEVDWIGGWLAGEISIFGARLGLDKMGGLGIALFSFCCYTWSIAQDPATSQRLWQSQDGATRSV
jgi:hypothetical protein